jgi:ABC-type lipopolysaccharide export system ATPase subunit
MRTINYLPEEPSLFERLEVYENLGKIKGKIELIEYLITIPIIERSNKNLLILLNNYKNELKT